MMCLVLILCTKYYGINNSSCCLDKDVLEHTAQKLFMKTIYLHVHRVLGLFSSSGTCRDFCNTNLFVFDLFV